jgi:glycosyltransferase involved in cell wall biosynthesis
MPLYSIQHEGVTKRRFERSLRIALETDADSADAVSAVVRSAVDCTFLETVAGIQSQKVPNGIDGVVTWLAGERLLCGSPALLRHDLRVPGRRSFVAVHLPCLDEMSLLALQPRWFCAGRSRDYWNFDVRISSPGKVSSQAIRAIESNGQPWAKLSRALLAEFEKPGSGIPSLLAMWEARPQLASMLAALVLRNLIVLLIHHRESAQAEQFLELGLKMFPGYAELAYVAALWNFRENRISRAVPYLEKAKSGDRGFLGSGGENTYRADWLMGLVALRVGNQGMAFDHFRRGLLSQPMFSPAVEELLKLRLPPRLVAAHQWEFCHAARRDPRLLGKVLDFLSVHRLFDPARQLIQAVPMDEASKEMLHDRLRAAGTAQLARKSDDVQRGILFSGPFFEHTSLGRINREVAASALSCSQWDVRLEPISCSSQFSRLFPKGDLLEPAVLRPLSGLDLTIRHQWPSDFGRPATGKLAVILPWEYGSVPRVWVREIESNVDELWVPSQFVRDVFRRSGVNGTAIEVIPNGFDPATFTPEGPVSRPQGCRQFAFLFVGGAIRRKGIDILLDAYQAAFDPGEDVSLVLHISGMGGSYRHNSLTQRLQQFAADPKFPHVQILSNPLDDATLASLYRGCNVLVLPYRGEGFGMPLLEAMACGKAVISTAAGPALDFCSEKVGYLIPAREMAVPDDPPPLGKFAGEFTWFEPDFGELTRTLRHVYEHPEEAANRGRAASKHAHRKYNWDHVTKIYRERIRGLAGAGTISSKISSEVLTR